MRILFVLGIIGFALLAVTSSFTQQEEYPPTSVPEPFELNWKITEGDTLFYETVLAEIGESEFEFEAGDMFKDTNDSLDIDELSRIQEETGDKLRNLLANTDFVTQLYPSSVFADVINIEMVGKRNEDDAANEFDQGFASVMTGVVLRGSVNTNGTLHSFWLKSGQKNLVALLFELPDGPVKAGDTWTLSNVNFVGNDQNFICLEAEKRNIVRLTEIQEVDGELIAIIDYDIREYVLGDFQAPVFFGEGGDPSKTTMEFSFQARAEFSIDQGKWLSYNGLLALESSGVMNSNSKQQFALIERE